eukprot:gene17908-20397_t
MQNNPNSQLADQVSPVSKYSNQSLDHEERKLISAQSIYSFDAGDLPNDKDTQTYDKATVAEITTMINDINKNKPTKQEQVNQQGALLRKLASRLCTLGTLEACEVFLDVLDYTSITSPSVAKYGLTAIANCTSSEEARLKLMQLGAGEFIVHMLKTFGEDHFSVAQYGIIAITNLTSNADIRNSLGGLNACQLIVQMLRLHAFKEEAPVAVYGLYAIGKLSLNHDLNRQRFGASGGCEQVVEVLKRLGASNHTITDYGMYALAHLAYFNLENKKRLSNPETYRIIMELLKVHGKEQISIASFGLTAVSNLIHTEASKDKFGALGMCELVQELGMHYKMKPEALANNVVFTIGKLTHKHAENSKLLARQSVPLIVEALQSYGVEKITQAGNGLFALGALIQHSNVALEKIVNVEVVELLVSLLSAHAVEDASVAVYGINILEAIVTHAVNKGDAIYSFLLKSLITQKIGALLCHIMSVYSYNEMNCNVEILGRAVYLLYFLSVKTHPSGEKLTSATGKSDYGVVELKQQLVAAGGVYLLQHAILDNVTVMDRVPNDQAQAILNVLVK